MKISRLISILAGGLVLAGCGGALETISEPSRLTPVTAPPGRIELAAKIHVSLPTGFGKVLKKDSVWKAVGKVDQGTVYRPVNDVFTFPAQWQHEAYLVVREAQLVGFYFPVERAFVGMEESVPLPLKSGKRH